MRIGFFEMEPWEEEYIRPKLVGHQLVFADADRPSAGAEIEVLSNFIGYPVSQETLNLFPKLKFITTRSTGYDHIDLAACAARGIIVSNVPTYGENTVAEFTFALLLAVSRKIYPAIKQVRERGLFATDSLQGLDLQGKTMGIIGTGHIGTYVVKIAKGFGMNVLAYDPYPKAELAQSYGFTYAALEDVLRRSDAVSLHVPYLPATHHLLNRQNIQLCKPGAIIINTARGGLIETAALVDGLKSGQIGGAGLDVLEEEGFVQDEIAMLKDGHPNEDQLKTVLADHELMYMDNVVVTPHNAFNTREALIRILDTTVSNIESFAKRQPENVVKA